MRFDQRLERVDGIHDTSAVRERRNASKTAVLVTNL